MIAAAGSPTKQEVSKLKGGADYAIDYTKPDWQKEVMKITGGKGVDVVFDPVGRIRGMSASVYIVGADINVCTRMLKVYCLERQGHRCRFRRWRN